MEAQVIKQASYKQDGNEEQNVALLVGQLGNNDPNVRWGAAIGLQRIGVAAADPLVRVISEGSAVARPPAIWALGKIDYPGSEKSLIEALSSDDEWTRLMAMASLTAMGSPGARVAVEKALANEDGSVRGILAELVEGS
jgi:HEAT repeat protein